MHAPDGFLTATTAIVTAGVSAASVSVALRQGARQLSDRQLPLAGMAAAFVFAAQMINFPVAAGTTGHLLGGALAAVLLGPRLAVLVTTVVVVVQALVFADGGLSALGYNVLNIAIVTSLGGWILYRLARRVLPANATGVSAAAGLAAGGSVVLSAMAFSVEWLFGASAPVAFDTVFTAMVGVHLVLGIVEGVITAVAVATVLAARPDLVHGANDLPRSALRSGAARSPRAVVLAGLIVAGVGAVVVSQFSASSPDGLERVAEDNGITGSDSFFASDLFADYATAGVDNPNLSLAIAGATGVLVTLLIATGLLAILRDSNPTVRT